MSAPIGLRVVSGFKWAGLSVAANLFFQLALTAVMARLLDPASFGVMAMGNVALRLFSYFSQVGMGAALVQKAQLEQQDIRCALGLTWLVCLAAMALVIVSSPLIGWFFRNEQVAALLQVLSVNLVLIGIGGIPMALLRRALRFREIAVLETASFVLGYGAIGIVAALAGAGIWSLVAATIGQSLICLTGAYALTRHPVIPSLAGDRALLLGYGVRHSLISFLEFLSANIDSAIIGRFLGESVLGLYSRALLLTNQPVERVAGIVAKVLFPVLSKVQQDRRKVGNVFLLGVSVIGLFGGATSAGISAAAADIVGVLLGPKWSDSVPVVEVLALSVPFIFMSNIAGIVCDSLALLHFKLRVQGAALAGIALLIVLMYPAGATGIAWAIVIGEILRFAAYVIFLARELQYKFADFVRVFGIVAGVSIATYTAVLGVADFSSRHDISVFPALIAESCAGLIVLLAGALLWTRLMAGSDPERLAANHLPGWHKVRTLLVESPR